MTTTTIIKTINKMCDGKCLYQVEQSKTTNSIYCTMQYGNAVTHFRVSDHHQTPRKIRSFVISKGTRVVSLERFINNAIKDLKKKSLYIVLESMPTIIEYV